MNTPAAFEVCSAARNRQNRAEGVALARSKALANRLLAHAVLDLLLRCSTFSVNSEALIAVPTVASIATASKGTYSRLHTEHTALRGRRDGVEQPQ